MNRADLKSSSRGSVVATVSASDVLRLHAKLPKLGLKLIQRMAKVCAAKEMHFLMEEAGLPKLKGKTLVDRVVRAPPPFPSLHTAALLPADDTKHQVHCITVLAKDRMI